MYLSPALVTAFSLFYSTTITADPIPSAELVAVSGGFSYLQSMAESIGQLAQANSGLVTEIEQMLKKEEEDDVNNRKLYGDRWKPPPSSTAAKM